MIKLKYILLSLIQGFTEPIPISSSGHIIIFKHILKSNFINDLNLEIFLNFGSMTAIILFFYDDILNLLKDSILFIKYKDNRYFDNFKYIIMVICATIPAGIIGLLFKDKIGSLSNIKTVGISLIITSFFLFIIRNIKGKKSDYDISFKDSIIIGFFQSIALLPGISRSGATIVGGMLCNLKRDTSFKFSFMLYIPISFATMILGVSDIVKSNISFNLILIYIFCMIISGIITFFATKWFKNIMKNGKFIYFSLYCIIVGIIVLFL